MVIRSSKDLQTVMGGGVTAVRLTELTGATNWHWVRSDTNEPIHGAAIKALEKRGLIKAIATDLCGDPMQMGPA